MRLMQKVGYKILKKKKCWKFIHDKNKMNLSIATLNKLNQKMLSFINKLLTQSQNFILSSYKYFSFSEIMAKLLFLAQFIK